MWLSVYDTMQIVQQEWFRLDAMHAPRERDETVKAEKQRSGALMVNWVKHAKFLR